ncbi:MAG: GDCCVxC domain-containing (seleno)protein [Chromatiaceae bacterium]
MTTAILTSTLTCPQCGHRREERMPTDACQWYYECHGCGALLKPKPGDCCVFCSYGSVPCPPVQLAAEDGPCCGASPPTHGDSAP